MRLFGCGLPPREGILPSQSIFLPGPVVSLGRSSCAVVSLAGSIPVVGGYDGYAAVDTSEVLSRQAMYFAAGPTMLTARYECAASAQPQGHSPRRALVLGGHDGTCEFPTTEVLTAAG